MAYRLRWVKGGLVSAAEHATQAEAETAGLAAQRALATTLAQAATAVATQSVATLVQAQAMTNIASTTAGTGKSPQLQTGLGKVAPVVIDPAKLAARKVGAVIIETSVVAVGQQFWIPSKLLPAP